MRCQIKQGKRQWKAVLMFLDPLGFFLPKKNPWMVKIIRNIKQHHGWYWYISYHNSKNGWYFEYRFHNVHSVFKKRLGQLTNHNSEEGVGWGGGGEREDCFCFVMFVAIDTFALYSFWHCFTSCKNYFKTTLQQCRWRVCMCVGGGGALTTTNPNTQSGKENSDLLETYIHI